MSQKVKTRFCPSPTGLVHLGNIRTALFNALFVRAHHGIFLLRIEDTDKERSKEKYTNWLQEDLTWLGLKWDEGPNVGGDNGPYHQSERQAIYDKYYAQLEKSGLAYPCFCSEEQLELSRKIQRSQGKPPRYAGTCRNLTKEEVEEKLAQGEKATLRFKVDEAATITFNDLVKGEQTFYGRDIGDFIIRRTDGTPPFMYCNAIDDAMMKVTNVFRGDDHLTNTPRQIMMLQALDLSVPQYGHISLIVGNDGAPLSKRTGSRSVQQLRAEGFLPIAINNYLARLGHHFEDESKLMTLDELAAGFKVESLGSAPARYDESQLLHWQKTAVLSLNADEFWDWLGEMVQHIVPKDRREQFVETVHPNVVFPVDAKNWAEIFFSDNLEFNDENIATLREAGESFFTTALEAIEQRGIDVKAITQMLKEKCNVKGKQLFMPLRLAATGQLHGPELPQVFSLLGKEKLKARLAQVLELI